MGMSKKSITYVVAAVAAILVLALAYLGYMFAATPSHIRTPEFEHYHFRTQIIVEGEPVDFSADRFQVANDTAGCNTELSDHPVDFHDNEDQMTHIHWDGMTGGDFLKYYGWNFIGGDDETLGRRFDHGMMNTVRMDMPHVMRFGNLLPDVPDGANFYVYVGDDDGYEKKNWDDFLNQNLEDFFGKRSVLKLNEQASNFRIDSWLFKDAAAHGGADDNHGEASGEQDLQRVNNLIGNVVIFVQADEPSDQQIKARFANLVPLTDSTCGG